MKPAVALAIALLVLTATTYAHPARAQSCAVTPTPLNFGTVNAIGGQPAQAQSTATFSCTGYSTPYVRVCANLGDDTAPRYLNGPSSARLRYEIYQDATLTTMWGSAWHGNPPLAVDIALSGGAGSVERSYYGSIFSGQTGSPAGSYAVTITSTIILGYGYTTTPPVCTTSGQTSWQTFQLASSATISSDCTLSATNVDFGQVGIVRDVLNSTGVVTATCTKATAYTLSLGAGTGAGATVASRRLTRSGGSDTLQYVLYRDSGRTQVWGDGTGGSTTVGGTGSGAAQTATVYAALPLQPAPPPGAYTDTITVTVTF